jgi:hypothetical protein
MPFRYIISAVALLVLFWWMWADLSTIIAADFASQPSDDALNRAGNWGDSFGGFNALVSALAFAAVLATLWIQGTALRQQQIDQHQQRFESSFFELLRLMREARREVRFGFSTEFVHAGAPTRKRSSTVETGPTAIMRAVIELAYWVKQGGAMGAKATKESLAEIYLRRVHRRYESTFGPYFRLIYTILYRIKADSVLSAEDKYRYANLLRGQLTSYEISLIAINGLAPIAKDLSALLTEFRVLKYLPNGTLRRTLETVYDEQAFAARD